MRNLLLLLCLFPVLSPLAVPQYRYYKGNTHTHTYPQSDADAVFTPQVAADAYKSRGYDFIVVTEHVAWWNASTYSSTGFLVINGEEVGISGYSRWGHLTALNINTRVTGKNCTHQATIDLIRGANAVPFMNHPRYSQIPITARQIIDSMQNNLRHMEIYNAVTAGQAGPTDISVWDSVLSTGRLMYGVAADDAHRDAHVGKAWIMVRAAALHKDSITQAVERGDFYPTTGILLDSIAYSPGAVHVRSANGTRIQFIGNNGTVLATVDSAAATYTVRGDEVYVRAEISNASAQKAWIQPMMVTNPTGVDEPRGKGESPAVPSFMLYDNYPNPFNPSTTIHYQLKEPGLTRLDVFDALGREVAVLVNQYQQRGSYSVDWHADNRSSGMYVCRLTVSGGSPYSQTKRMMLLR